jgi:hypothetical protein
MVNRRRYGPLYNLHVTKKKIALNYVCLCRSRCLIHRFYATDMLRTRSSDGIVGDVLESVKLPAGFVDAQCLSFLWLEELSQFRVSVVSGDLKSPIFSVFCKEKSAPCTEVLIRCSGSHFTLLRPRDPSIDANEMVTHMLRGAEASSAVVLLDNQVEPCSGRSVSGALVALLGEEPLPSPAPADVGLEDVNEITGV